MTVRRKVACVIGCLLLVTCLARPVAAQSTAQTFALRLVGSLLGGAIGGAFGGFLGYGGLLVSRRSCGDLTQLCSAAVGGVSGVVLGSALGGAVPVLQSPCRFGRRVATGLLGSVTGGLTGLLAGRRGWILLTVPVGAIVGSPTALLTCLRRVPRG